jgi:adenine-specific DNA-methyltransferase
MDEVFGAQNSVVTIVVKKKGSTTPTDPVNDYVLWYAKDRGRADVRRLTAQRGDPEDDPKFNTIISPAGEHRRTKDLSAEDVRALLEDGWEWARVNYPIVSQHPHPTRSNDYQFRGRTKRCGPNKQWRFDVPSGLDRLNYAERLFDGGGESLGGIARWKDWPVVVLSNFWDDTKGEENPVYVVQTAWKVVQRCMLMTTSPGDLVLDATCGSGTTAYVAEQWGRRWITIDTSRVALSLARQRLLTARFDFYKLRDERSGAAGNFVYTTVPHITLKSIANGRHLDPIFDKHDLILDARLTDCNKALSGVAAAIRRKLDAKLADKQSSEGKRSITHADTRRWSLPKKDQGWQHWQVPFDTDPDWPKALQDAVTEYRKAWRAKMDEVNAGIAANAKPEELVDQPEVVKGVVRVSGPFTVEGVMPAELSLDQEGLFGGAPEELPMVADAPATYGNGAQIQNVRAYLQQMCELLQADGVRFPNNRQMRFSRFEPLYESGIGDDLHAEARWHAESETDADPEGRCTVCIGLGPQYGPVTAYEVEELVRTAARRGYDDLVVAGFSFDPEAAAAIEEASHPKLKVHMAHIRPDVNPGMKGLLKTTPSSQLFTVFGMPQVDITANGNGEFICKLEGVDIYDPVENVVRGTGASKVAAWFLDSDYDGQTFCICQAFFPDRPAQA